MDSSKGFAFLCFTTPGEASRAMAEMNGAIIGDKPITISLVELKPGQGLNSSINKQYMKDKIFVKNLLASIDNEELKSLFLKFGGIVEAKVILNEHGKSKGVGFVQFFSKKSAERAVIEMNGRSVKHIPVFVSFAEIKPGKKIVKAKPAQPVSVQKDKIFVSNLPANFNNAKLKDLFARFGNISSAKMVSDKRIGFVQFIFARDAEAAVHAMNGQVCGTKPIRVVLANNRPGHTNDPFYAPRKPTYEDLYDENDLYSYD